MFHLVKRKMIATFVSASFSSICIAGIYMLNGEGYQLGTHFAGWTMFYLYYIGVIIFVYGNLVSAGIEYVHSKWFKFNNGWYVFIHGIFGLANGLVFGAWGLAVCGMLAALFYAWIDRWLYSRIEKEKGYKMFLLSPIFLFGITWVCFQLGSRPLPPFTPEAAVEFATSGSGTVIDLFPEKISKWEGEVGSFQVVRETYVEEIGHESYIVTFTEKWESEHTDGTWFLSYEVERGTLTMHDQGGPIPPYRE